jgi:hypothetical protein
MALAAELPLRKPPLHVVQWVTDSPLDKLHSKAERERFYGMSVRARQAAVKAFYRDADPLLKKAGLKDFVLVVTPLTETTKDLPAFAIGRDGSASLTDLGRGVNTGS